MRCRSAVICAFCAALSLGTSADNEVSPTPQVHENSFLVAGYALRTNNADEISGHGKIGELWRRFVQQNLGSTIPHRTDSSMIALYSDYSSNEKGEFTYLLGARVSSVRGLSAKLSYRKIAPGEYVVFTTRLGPVVEVLPEEWNTIWKCRPDQLGGGRAFITDYEVYDQRSANPMKAQIDIHIGLKSNLRSGN